MSSLKNWLMKQANKPQRNIIVFSIGVVVFFIGSAILIFSDQTLNPSLGQELIALSGITLMGIGSITTLTAYLCLSVLRILKIISDD